MKKVKWNWFAAYMILVILVCIGILGYFFQKSEKENQIKATCYTRCEVVQDRDYKVLRFCLEKCEAMEWVR